MRNKKEEDFFSREVIRPVSHYLALLFIKLGVSANAITHLKFIVGLLGLVFLGLGGYVNMATGAFILIISYILDRVDGDVAKATGTSSKLGEYIDSLSDYIIDILVPVVVGYGLAQSACFLLEPHLYIYIGLSFALLRVIRRHTTLLIHQVFFSRPTALVKQGLLIKLGALLYYVEYFILFISALSELLELFLFLYTAIEIVGTVVFIRAAVIRGKEQ